MLQRSVEGEVDKKIRGVDLDIALNLSTSSWLSVDSPLFSSEPWLLEKFLLEKCRAGANLEEGKLN